MGVWECGTWGRKIVTQGGGGGGYIGDAGVVIMDVNKMYQCSKK